MAVRFTVLLIDDNPALHAALQQRLGYTYTVLAVAQPVEALTFLATRRPDAVVLPVALRAKIPWRARRMDGIDLCTMIKRSPLQRTPVILYSERDNLLEQLRARRSGTDCLLGGGADAAGLADALREAFSPRIIAARLHSGEVFQPHYGEYPSHLALAH